MAFLCTINFEPVPCPKSKWRSTLCQIHKFGVIKLRPTLEIKHKKKILPDRYIVWHRVKARIWWKSGTQEGRMFALWGVAGNICSRDERVGWHHFPYPSIVIYSLEQHSTPVEDGSTYKPHHPVLCSFIFPQIVCMRSNKARPSNRRWEKKPLQGPRLLITDCSKASTLLEIRSSFF